MSILLLYHIICILCTLRWPHNERDGVSNHQPHDCLLNRLFRRSSKKTSKLRVTGLCGGNSPVTGEFPTQRTSNEENASIWCTFFVTESHCVYWAIALDLTTTIISLLDNVIALYHTVAWPNSGLDKMAANFQTLSNASLLNEKFVFWCLFFKICSEECNWQCIDIGSSST